MASTSSALQQLCVPQVATVLVSLHQECLQGNFQRIKALQQSTPANNTAASQRQQARTCCIALLALSWQDSLCKYAGFLGFLQVDRDGTVLDDDSSDNSSQDGSDMQMDEAEAPAAVHLDASKAPVVDDDGFELVQGKSKGRRRQHGVH